MHRDAGRPPGTDAGGVCCCGSGVCGEGGGTGTGAAGGRCGLGWRHYRLGTIADVNGNLHHPGGRADLAQFNGGSQVIATKDGALAVIHGFHKTDTFLRRYFHFFVTFNEAGSPITISEPFTLTGQQVEVVNGLCAHPDGKRLVLSYGRMGADPSMPHQELAFTETIDPKELELVS